MQPPDQPATVVVALMGGMLFGLTSVPHCFSMCGPLHVAMCLASKKRSFKSLTLFNLGRIAGYTVIGIACGFFGAKLSGFFYKPMDIQKIYGNSTSEELPKSCCEAAKANASETAKVPKSCCEAAKAVEAPKVEATPPSCCGGKATSKAVEPKKATVPKSCCEAAEANAPGPVAVPKSCCEAAAQSTTEKPKLGLGSTARRLLMFIFPAVILILVGIKGIMKRPAAVGVGGGGFLGKLFNRFQSGGPVTCGVGASLIPCGMLYVAFAFAVSTLSAFLGGVFMFAYCFTITFFMQLGIMVGTTFGKKLSGKVDRLFPWLAFAGATVYVLLFLFWK